jgi:RNA polymerase sigma factor (sigma-70 family)
MVKRSRASRYALVMSPDVMRMFRHDQAAWYESEEDVEEGLEWGRRKAALLKWMRRQIGRRLTARERRFIELYFFEGLSYRETADREGTALSHVHRTVQRGLRKLRAAAAEDRAALAEHLTDWEHPEP